MLNIETRYHNHWKRSSFINIFSAYNKISSGKTENALITLIVHQQSRTIQELGDETPDTRLGADSSVVSQAAKHIQLQNRRTILTREFMEDNKVN